MKYSVLEKSVLFTGVSAKELRETLTTVPHRIQSYDKGETVFYSMEEATRIGLILDGRVQAQKLFPNGSQINVSVRKRGEMIGPAAAFARNQKYPCDIVSLEPSTIILRRLRRCLGDRGRFFSRKVYKRRCISAGP